MCDCGNKRSYPVTNILAAAGAMLEASDLSVGVTPPEKARVQVVAYLNPDCGHCAEAFPVLQEMLTLFPDDVSITYRLIGAPEDSTSKDDAENILISEGVYAAQAQKPGSGIKLLEAIFNFQGTVTPSVFKSLAEEIGLDAEALFASTISREFRASPQAHYQSWQKAGGTYVPYIVINGQVATMELNSPDLAATIRERMDTPIRGKNTKPRKSARRAPAGAR